MGSAAPAGSRAGVGGGRIRGWGRPLGQLLRAAAWKTPHVEEERSGDREPRARGYRAGTRCARHGGPAARRRVPPAPRLPSLPLTSQPFVSSQPFGASVPRPAAPRLAALASAQRAAPPPPTIASGSGGQGRPQSAPRRGQVRERWPRGTENVRPEEAAEGSLRGGRSAGQVRAGGSAARAGACAQRRCVRFKNTGDVFVYLF